jgi:hypothetical protein
VDIIAALAVASALAAAAYTLFLAKRRREELWAWLHNFIATLISIIFVLVIGIFLFNYQSDKSEEMERQYLSRLLSAEVRSNTELLEKEPSLSIEFAAAGRKEKVLFAYPSSLVLKDAIRSGLFPTAEVRRMAALEHNIALYNNMLASLLSYLTASSPRDESVGVILVGNINKTRMYLLRELEYFRKEAGLPGPAPERPAAARE